jgi:hypothetical protein
MEMGQMTEDIPNNDKKIEGLLKILILIKKRNKY